MGQPHPARRRAAMWTAFVATVMLGAVWGWTCFSSDWVRLSDTVPEVWAIGVTRGSVAVLHTYGITTADLLLREESLFSVYREPEVGVLLLPTHGWSGSFRMLTLPLWMPVAASAALTYWFWRRCRVAPGRCPSCGYSLAGLPGGAGCPECGPSPGPR